MSLSPSAPPLLGVVLGIGFGHLLGMRQGEEDQLSESEKATLAKKLAEIAHLWPFIVLIFVVNFGFIFLLDMPFRDLLVYLWLVVLAFFADLGSRKRQRLVREILTQRPAAVSQVAGQP